VASQFHGNELSRQRTRYLLNHLDGAHSLTLASKWQVAIPRILQENYPGKIRFHYGKVGLWVWVMVTGLGYGYGFSYGFRFSYGCRVTGSDLVCFRLGSLTPACFRVGTSFGYDDTV
jgi:hypothetical protein